VGTPSHGPEAALELIATLELLTALELLTGLVMVQLPLRAQKSVDAATFTQ
jgi:hypothetical protein